MLKMNFFVRSSFYILCAFELLCAVGVYCMSDTECLELGFVKSDLSCSSCNLTTQFDLSILKDDCLNCCQLSEFERHIKRYPKARLEVCTCKFGAYPQIQAFVKSNRPDQFSNLQIRYIRGANPVIKLLDEAGNIQEVLAIEKWNTDSIEEFFKLYLEQPDEQNFLKTNKL